MKYQRSQRPWRQALKGPIRNYVHKHPGYFQKVLGVVGLASTDAEGAVRRTLALPPPFLVELSRSPNGSKLAVPLKMLICEGRDQSAVGLSFGGWSGFEYPLPLLFESLFLGLGHGHFFDVGANTGVYSLLSKAVDPHRSVHAFEPFPPALAILRENVAINPTAGDICITTVAASDENGTAELFIPTQEHGLIETSASLSSTFRSAHSDVLTATTMTLDSYVESIGGGPVAIMKIDTEGVEDRVLRGASELMKRDRPVVICEILAGTPAWESVPSIMDSAGYVAAEIGRTALVLHNPDGRGVTSSNHLLIPHERLPRVRELTRSVGLELRLPS